MAVLPASTDAVSPSHHAPRCSKTHDNVSFQAIAIEPEYSNDNTIDTTRGESISPSPESSYVELVEVKEEYIEMNVELGSFMETQECKISEYLREIELNDAINEINEYDPCTKIVEITNIPYLQDRKYHTHDFHHVNDTSFKDINSRSPDDSLPVNTAGSVVEDIDALGMKENLINNLGCEIKSIRLESRSNQSFSCRDESNSSVPHNDVNLSPYAVPESPITVPEKLGENDSKVLHDDSLNELMPNCYNTNIIPRIQERDLNGNLISNDFADYVMVECEICHEHVTMTRLRSHTKDVHVINITEYKWRYGTDLIPVEKVYHQCGKCGSLVLLDSDHIAQHLKSKRHNITHKDYNAAYMVDSRLKKKSKKRFSKVPF